MVKYPEAGSEYLIVNVTIAPNGDVNVSGCRIRIISSKQIFKSTSPPVQKVEYGCVFVRQIWKKYGNVSGSQIRVFDSEQIFKYNAPPVPKFKYGFMFRRRLWNNKNACRTVRCRVREWLIGGERVVKFNSLPDLWLKFGGWFGHRIWNRFIDWRSSRLRVHEINVLIDFRPVPYVTSGAVSGFRAEKRCSTVQYSIK